MKAKMLADTIDELEKLSDENGVEQMGEPLIFDGDELPADGGNRSLSDEEFICLFDKSQFEIERISAEILFDKFYENAESAFFQSFREREKIISNFRRSFGDARAQSYIEKAEKIVAGKFDLINFENLDFGVEIDWHFDPISGRRSPLKHWKQFDELSTGESGAPKIIRELNRCQHFFTLGVAFRLTRDERFAETFARQIQSWMRQNPVGAGINWSSSSEAALRSVSWIWAFQFFKDSTHFTAEIFFAALKSLYFHASHIEKYLSTYISPNTNLTGEALGLYYLGTQLPFFERAAVWRETGEKILLSELDRQILPDGVYFERSTRRQRYTTDFYTHFYILRQLNGGESADDSQSKLDRKLQSSLDFLTAVARPDGTTPRLGADDDDGRILPRGNDATDDFRACLAMGAAIFRRGDYKFAARRFAEETLWLLGADGEEIFKNLEAETPVESSAAFDDGNCFVMRDGWSETDNYLLVNNGETGALSINAAIGGKTLLGDSEIDTPDEPKAARNYLLRATETHNVLTIDAKSNPQSDAAFNRQNKAQANPRRWISQERFDFFEGARDVAVQQSSAPAKHTRSVLFLKNDYWIMRDFVETSGEHRYALDFNFAAAANIPSIERTETGACVGAKFDEKFGARLFCFGDNASWTQKEKSSVSTARSESRAASTLLKFVSVGVGSQEFFTFLLPRENSFAAPEVCEVPVGGGRAFVLYYRDYRDIFVFADGGQIVRTELFNTNFRFFWARLSEGEDLPEEFVLIDGTHFSIENRKIIDESQPSQSATARRFGNQVHVRSSVGAVSSISLPTKKPPTYVLK